MNQKSLKISFDNYSTEIPYFEFIGKENGPHLFITGGMHGDEINGIHLVKRFVNWFQKEQIESELKGKVTVFPILNISGFRNTSRYVAEDGADLNRSFGFEQPKNFSEQIAKELTEQILSKCDFGIDCHDSGGRSVLIPHSRVHKCEPLNCETVSKEMGQIFGTTIILEREGYPNMLSVHLKDKYDISVITIETGGAQIIFDDFIETGLKGIKNILVAKQMIKGEIYLPSKQYILHSRFGEKATEAAEIKFFVELGDYVKEGDKICELYFPTKFKSQVIFSHKTGIIFSKLQTNQTSADKIIYSILEVDEIGNKYNESEEFHELGKVNIAK